MIVGVWVGTWVLLALLVGYVGSQRGRDGVGLFFLSLVLSPIVGFLVAIGLPVRERKRQARTPGHWGRPAAVFDPDMPVAVYALAGAALLAAAVAVALVAVWYLSGG